MQYDYYILNYYIFSGCDVTQDGVWKLEQTKFIDVASMKKFIQSFKCRIKIISIEGVNKLSNELIKEYLTDE